MSFIERMMDKVDRPEKDKEADDDQLSAKESALVDDEPSPPHAQPEAGFIPGIDGDLPADAIAGFEEDGLPPDGPLSAAIGYEEPASPFTDPARGEMPGADIDEFDDLPAMGKPFADPEPATKSAAQADPDTAFADALARYDVEDSTGEIAVEAAAEPPSQSDQIEWDTRPDFLISYGEEPDEPLAEESSSTVEETPNPVVAEAVPDEAPLAEESTEESPHSADDLLAAALSRDLDASDSVDADERAVEADREAGKNEPKESHVEAVGDDIGLPPEMPVVRAVDDLDDFDDFDDLDESEPGLASRAAAVAAAMPKPAARRPNQADDQPEDDFDDDGEFDDVAEEPRRVGNHVNLDLEHLSDIGVITPDNARGKVAEEYRLIKRPLLLNIIGEGEVEVENPNIIMVSSSLPGEGKTFTSVNLAMSMAMELDRTVLLVDADVAKPSFSRVFDMETEGGLIDVLLGDATLEEVLLTTNVPKLRLLPAGRRHANSVELLASDHMRRLTKELATRYENRIIVFDSPPLLATTEAGVLASLMSQLVLVIEANKTPQYVVQESLKILDHSKYIGLVLNKSRSSGRSSYYYDYRYPYYYGYGQ